MPSTRSQRSAWNLASGLLMTGLTLGVGFCATPWILRWLGAERFGAYRVLMDWFGWLTIFDLGVLGAVIARLGPKAGAGDERGVFEVLNAGFYVYLRIAAAMLLGGAALVWGLPYVIKGPHIPARELRIAAWILVIPVAWTPFSVFRALTEARQRGYLVNLLLSMQALLTSVLLVLTAWAGWGLIGQTAATAIPMAPLAGVLTYLGVRRYPGVLSAKASREAIGHLRSLNWPTFWFNLSGRLGLLSDNIVVGWILGPLAVAPFFLTQRIGQIAQLQLQSIGNATWAGLVELHAQGQKTLFCARLAELTSLVSGIGLVVLGPIAAYNRHFIGLWVGSGSYAGEWVNALACVNIWMWAISSLWTWPISGAGHISEWVPYAVPFTVINIAVSVGATYLAGVSGPLIGTFAAFVLVQSWGLPRVLAAVFDGSLKSIWKAAAAPLVWALPYNALLWVVAKNHAPAGWIGLAGESGAALLGGLFLWWLSLGSGARRQWQLRLRGAMAL